MKAGKAIAQYAAFGAALATGVAVFEVTYDAFCIARKAVKAKLEAKAAKAAEEADTEEKAPETEDTTVEE